MKVRMTSPAVLNGEGDRKVADAAKLASIDEVHTEVLGPLFLDIEYVGMAVGAVEPFRVPLVGE